MSPNQVDFAHQPRNIIAPTSRLGTDTLIKGAIYVPLCVGIKSLVCAAPTYDIMTIDDILDHDVDGLVARTKGRALPRGAISLERAWLFFTIQVAVGIYLAINCLGETSLYISMTVWPLYNIPNLQGTRWTYLAPIPLVSRGVMFNVGIFMGWADLNRAGNIPWKILVPIYIGTCCWTVTYETVYQHQDIQDDVTICLKSMAILFGKYTIPLCTLTGSLWGTDIDNPASCKAFFLRTPLLGQIILCRFIWDAVAHRLEEGLGL
ncbi:UbiA prenyltransferase [Mycena olivaceomarginata]|nr:UbiA prenyltransferase [Mycena olivaceomarginata]